MDVTRALLLPDFQVPAEGLLRNLALYWDEIAWVRRSGRDDDSAVVDALRDHGVLVDVAGPEVSMTRVLEPWTGHDRGPREGEEAFLAFEKDEFGRRVFKRYLWLDRSQLGPPNAEPAEDPAQDDYAWGRLIADRYVSEVEQAIALCARQNFAPLAASPEAHLASLVGETPPGVPTREAALLSVVLTMFEVSADTPIDEILAFREKHYVAMARFRASLGALASELREDVTPETALAQARDVVRNRIEPALSDLEDVLKQSRLKFVWKAALGASAISLAPISPTVAVQGSTQVVGHTLDYTLNKQALVRSHPYGYLHAIGSGFGRAGSPVPAAFAAIGDPQETLREFFRALYAVARDLH
jgi:hypothetical protein